MRRTKLYSNKIDNHYIHLVTGARYYAPLGLFNTQTAWVVRRFCVEKNFPLDKHHDALDFLQKLNKQHGVSDTFCQRGKRKYASVNTAKFDTKYSGINIRITNTSRNEKRLFVVYYSPIKKIGCYLAGSSIIVQDLNEYNINMHAHHIRRAIEIRRSEKLKIENEKERQQKKLFKFRH